MTIDCYFNWHTITEVTGSCIRPGGHVLSARALEICNLPPGSRVADIGCGAGGTLEYLERTGHYHAVGLDSSDALLGESVSRLTTARLVQGSAGYLPFKESSFDALFFECVLSIFSDKTAPIFESVRVLKDGGFLIISDVFTTGGAGPVERGPQQLPPDGIFTKDDILRTLTGLGLSLFAWEEHEKLLKEFVAQLILAGQCLPDPWGYGAGFGTMKKADRPKISYFLLIARKEATGHLV